MIDLLEEVTWAIKNDLALKAESLMLDEDAAMITKLEVVTRESGALLNPEAVEVLSPVDVVTINRLVVEETDLPMKATAEVVLSLENTEVEEVTKAEVEVKIRETVGVVSATLLTLRDKDPDLKGVVTVNKEINTGLTMNPHLSQLSREALAEEAGTHEEEVIMVPSQKNKTTVLNKILAAVVTRKTQNIMLHMSHDPNKPTTMSSGPIRPIEMTSMCSLLVTNRILISLERMITREEDIEAEAVATLKNQTIGGVVITSKTTKDPGQPMEKMISPTAMVAVEGMAPKEVACVCEVGSKIEAEEIEEVSEDTAVVIKKEAAIKLVEDTVATEATSEEEIETSTKEEGSIQTEEHKEAVGRATTKANLKTRQNISRTTKMENLQSRKEVMKLTEEKSNWLSIGSAKRYESSLG